VVAKTESKHSRTVTNFYVEKRNQGEIKMIIVDGWPAK